MSSKIKDGDLCVFEWYNKVGGTREGDIVLIYAEDKLSDGSTYTIKKYHSEKRNVDDTWSHEKIILYPLNSDYDPIELEEGQKVYTVGVFKCVL
jgi:SOS-response transcriptional repressor LexA